MTSTDIAKRDLPPLIAMSDEAADSVLRVLICIP